MIKIFAKDTIPKIVDTELSQNFVKENHSQGATSEIKVKSVALLHGDEVVAVAQFCIPRTAAKQREYSTELLRLAFKKNIRVVGGASKLIKYYISEYNPADVFTYQDVTGENTNVYASSGFSFVSQDKKKEYLVAPGKTLETGNRKEVLGMPYATQYGPDRILGTKLGEVIDSETGKRKSNKRIFIEELGWHVETTPGDKVYEWFNPNMTHYVYKITASDSDKYYYGVSHVKKANATIQDCLDDRYYGSGGEKFKNWKKKHNSNLQKEILNIFSKVALAYNYEKEILSDLWKTDSLCLNSTFGGRLPLPPRDRKSQYHEDTCHIHGLVVFQGDSCRTCVAESFITVKTCEIHGSTKFQGESCAKCSNDSVYSVRFCNIHKESNHRGATCMKCSSERAYSLKNCEVHGLVSHVGDSCSTCNAEKAVSIDVCDVHGKVSFYGGQCVSCRVSTSVDVKYCEIHGDSKHIGGKCFKCRDSSTVEDFCDVHGISQYNGDSCLKCKANESVVFKVCKDDVKHGSTKHMNGVCALCRSQNAIGVRVCEFHGETKHRGLSCAKCNAEKAAHVSTHVDDPRSYCRLCVAEFGIEYKAKGSLLEKVCELCDKSFETSQSKQRFCSNPHVVNCAVCGKENSVVPRKDKKLYVCFKGNCRSQLKYLDVS